MEFTRLESRAVLVVEGEDRLTFLQGLISNDITKATPDHAIWAGFLTPQGKFQHDLFLFVHGESILIDAEAERLEAFIKRLTMFKLRSKLTLRVAPELSVWAAWGQDAAEALGNINAVAASVDPRLAAIGLRVILPTDKAAGILEDNGFAPAPFDHWDLLRLKLGLPDGSRDMQVDSNLLLELGFEELNGVDFKKGCYMGQETTTRSKHRKLIKRRLVPVTIAGPTPAPGTPITAGEAEAGHMCSALGDTGLAFVRLDHLNDALICGGAKLTPHVPDWAEFPAVE